MFHSSLMGAQSSAPHYWPFGHFHLSCPNVPVFGKHTPDCYGLLLATRDLSPDMWQSRACEKPVEYLSLEMAQDQRNIPSAGCGRADLGGTGRTE